MEGFMSQHFLLSSGAVTASNRAAHDAPPFLFPTHDRRGNAMRSIAPLGMLATVLFASPFADAATLTGTVTGPDGAPFRAAFVQARNAMRARA